MVINNIKKHINELDFLKGVFITLMVLFHLVPFVQQYPKLTEWVYCFHMSGFLIISGYLQDSSSNSKFIKSTKKILIPYFIFEIFYIIGLGLLQDIVGSANRIDLSLGNIVYYVLLQPSGTYWYLHTLFICLFVSFIIGKININIYGKLILTTSILFFLSILIGGLSFENIIYFIIGKIIQISKYNIISIIRPTPFSILPIVIITLFNNEFSRGNLSGIVMTFSIMSFLLYIYKYINNRIIDLVEFLGKNTLGIVLFSPLYTVLTKFYLHLFYFDNTSILWALISLLLVLTMCLLSSWIFDKLFLSRFLFNGSLFYSYK